MHAAIVRMHSCLSVYLHVHTPLPRWWATRPCIARSLRCLSPFPFFNTDEEPEGADARPRPEHLLAVGEEEEEDEDASPSDEDASAPQKKKNLREEESQVYRPPKLVAMDYPGNEQVRQEWLLAFLLQSFLHKDFHDVSFLGEHSP